MKKRSDKLKLDQLEVMSFVTRVDRPGIQNGGRAPGLIRPDTYHVAICQMTTTFIDETGNSNSENCC